MKKALKAKHGLMAMLVLWSIFQMIQLDNEWDRMDGDDAQYILHAQSLVVNHRYNAPNLIFLPGAITTPESTPPGWPILLVPIIALFGVKLGALKLFVVLFALVSGMYVYKIALLRTDSEKWSVLIAGVYYFSMTTMVFSRVVYSEWPYVLASYVALYMALPSKNRNGSVFQWAWIGLFAGMALLCRSVGLSLVCAIFLANILESIIHKRIKNGLIKIILFIAAFFLIYQPAYWVTKPEKKAGYKSEFLLKDLDFQEEGNASIADIVNRIPKNMSYLLKSLEPQLIGRYWHEYPAYRYPALSKVIQPCLYLLGLLIFIFISTGFFLQIRKKPTVLEYYIFCYMFMMSVIWFNYEVYRYLMPIAPFLFLYLIQGLSFWIGRFGKRDSSKNRYVYAFLWIVLVLNVIHSAIEIYKYKYSEHNAKASFLPYRESVAWLKQHAMPDAIIIADEPRWYALETGLNVTTFLKSRNPDKVMHYIEQFPRSIIVFDNQRRFQKICLVPVFQKYGNRFRLLQQFGHIQIYQHSKSSDG